LRMCVAKLDAKESAKHAKEESGSQGASEGDGDWVAIARMRELGAGAGDPHARLPDGGREG